MNTNSLKRFATVARTLLMQGVRNRLKAVGFNDDGSVRVEPKASGNSAIFDGQVINDYRFVARWNALRDRIASHGVKEVVEEAAYTWFNRLMAIRILQYNSLAPALLDYENPEVRIPRIVTEARAGKTPVLSDEDRDSLEAIIGNGRLSFEQFSLLIRAYCENNPIIRKCFGGITDYTMLLLPADILAEDGFIDLLNKTGEFIEPDDYRKPELIGWLYQFYISDKKDVVFAKKGGYDSDEIPAATQIFTPNWIVKYMVENTLGRIYLDNNPDSTISENWKYLVTPAEPTPDDAILRYDSLEDLKCGDLSCGSGHILNEMFDLLYSLYAEEFYSPREAIEAILTKNMVGIDIDDRARQLAQFALLLKACQTDSSFADGHCMPRIYSMPDSYPGSEEQLRVDIREFLGGCDKTVEDELVDSIQLFDDAHVLGSIMKFNLPKDIFQLVEGMLSFPTIDRSSEAAKKLFPFFEIIYLLSDKYAALCMNPPYMPSNKEATLKAYSVKEYPDSKSDLFAIFMDVATDRLCEYGKYGMINMQSWMFLSSFETLRKKIIETQQIDSLLHLGSRTFDELSGEVVQNAVFVISKEKPTNPGIYYRLIDGVNCNAKREMILAGNSRYVVSDQKQFEQIPGAPIAYWVSEEMRTAFLFPLLHTLVPVKKGLDTGNNDYFLKLWHEVSFRTIGIGQTLESFNAKWAPHDKGGTFRRWYGNNDWIILWENNGAELRQSSANLRSENLYFSDAITWSSLASGNISFRLSNNGAISNTAGSSLYPPKDSLLRYCSVLNSIVTQAAVDIISPTLNYSAGPIGDIPISTSDWSNIDIITQSCISISKQDWDAHETSWDFETSPLLSQAREMPAETNVFSDHREADIEILYPEYVRCDANLEDRQHTVRLFSNSLYSLYIAYRQKWTRLFAQLQSNEIEINQKFIEIYGLQDELSPNVSYEDITILQQGEATADGDDVDGTVLIWNKDVIIKQFISYAIGCMMGRYRLDRPGLAIAHSNPSADEYAPYVVPQTGEQWWIDDDGIVPMMGEDSPFHDNAANRFTEFVRVALGNEYLTENMNFVREALGKDVVDYFRSDFYGDHKKMYQNRPIYWMFSSNQKGKRAAFQCLVYIHRMNRFTPEHIRTNYLLPYIEHLAAREADLKAKSSLTSKENKELKQLRSDLEECRDYQLRLHEFADRQIEIDLDDGVVKNYATFAPVLAKLK